MSGTRNQFYKCVSFALCMLVLIALAGCASLSETSDTPVRLGMLRDDLRYHYGEPLRIEKDPSGGENWYYYFVSWKPHGSQEATTVLPGADPSISVSVGVSRESEEHGIHLSPDGVVTKPLPEGKVVPR